MKYIYFLPWPMVQSYCWLYVVYEINILYEEVTNAEDKYWTDVYKIRGNYRDTNNKTKNKRLKGNNDVYHLNVNEVEINYDNAVSKGIGINHNNTISFEFYW